MAEDFFHQIVVTDTSPADRSRNMVGGPPILAAKQHVPRCKLCDERMILFLQLDVRADFGLDFEAGSHLLLFMCKEHNECAQGEPPSLQEHYAMLLNRPYTEEYHAEGDGIIVARELQFVHTREFVEPNEYLKSGKTGTQAFKIGGVPCWFNFDHHDPAYHDRCEFCGAPYAFILEIPEYFDFEKTESAPEQPDGSSSAAYNWLLGNECYVLGCSAQCDPRSLIVLNDN